ncbi:PIN domain-containing protein [Paraburkholderia unamae]|uniref:PIN domain-containing protein n=1 Tax=Paraburkholderia unamae TaxID=219649 RepID=A0ACC6RK21_9BURK
MARSAGGVKRRWSPWRQSRYARKGAACAGVVAAELHYGCAKKGSAKLLTKVESVLATIPVLPLEVPADTEYGRIRAELESAGQKIGANDLLIGAHACALGLTLVTNNTREFSRISGLTIENWLEQ